VSAALETVNIVKAESAVTRTRQAFGVSAAPPVATAGADAARPSVPAATLSAARRRASGSAAPPRPALPEQSRVPLRQTAPSARRDLLPSAPPAPHADQRAITFGAGVPLRPRVGGAVEGRRRALHTVTPARAPLPASTRRDPTRAPWLTRRHGGDSGSAHSARPQGSNCGCGCGGGCGCGSGAER
jgi:hypothetical protein